MKQNIELTDSHTVMSRGVSVTVDVTKLSPTIVASLALHGLTQKVADAASQAKSIAEDSDDTLEQVTESLMQKAIDNLIAGEWSQRASGGGGVDEFTRVARMIVRNAVKGKLGSKSTEWKDFAGLSNADQNAKLDEWYSDNEKLFKPVVTKKVAERKAEREAKAELANAVDFDM